MRLQGIKKSLNLHFRPNPILVTVSLALILMAIGPVIIWMLIPFEALKAFYGEPYYGELVALVPYWFACFMWFGVITLLAGLAVRRFRPNSLYPPIVVGVGLLLVLMFGGLVVITLIFLLQTHVTLQLAGAAGFMWFLFTLLAGLIAIAGRMDKRVSMVEKSQALQH